MITSSIVLYKNTLEECHSILDCLLASPVEKIFLVDHSGDDKLSVLKDYSPKIEYIQHENSGYGAGHNIAIKKAIEMQSDYHLILNADVLFRADVVGEMSSFMDKHPDIGILVPKVFYPDGSLQYTCKLSPSIWDMFCRRFLPSALNAKHDYFFTMQQIGYDNMMLVPFVSGCFILLRVSAAEINGLFDERFFMYYEDVDLGRRMLSAYKNIYYPKVSIIHDHGDGSRKKVKMLLIHIRNLMRYFGKWGYFFDKDRKRINHYAITWSNEHKGNLDYE